uniref:Uncharacterized protein n=1 Tax=Streptomyces sp. F12 TaxID=1436084 RepID=V9Z4M4_9ACTN|nr:hypothetical protein [Streptomyces sp. F12]AHE40415.1 hypothetical protein pFRL6_328 [Streptomyces sp. F12]
MISPHTGNPAQRPASDGVDAASRPPAAGTLPADGACRALRHTASTITDDAVDRLYEALARSRRGHHAVGRRAAGEERI